jgi:mycothiol synthase
MPGLPGKTFKERVFLKSERLIKMTTSGPTTAAGSAAKLFPRNKMLLRPGAEVEIRRIEPEEIDQALALFLTNPSDNRLEIERKTSSFRELARQEQYDLNRQMVGLYDGQMIHASLFVPQAGGTAFVFLSRPAQTGPEGAEHWELAAQTLREMCRWASLEGSNLLQVLIEPTDTVRRELCLAADFRHLTDLIYMFRIGEEEPAGLQTHGELSWLKYDQQHHDLFKQVIKQTYRGSLDCPELDELRDIEDVVGSHKAAGVFDRRYWQLLIRGDKPIGVLLLIPLRASEAMELTYMGLCPGARGEGLGAFMLQEAISCARQCQNRMLALAVDCRNQIAFQLYGRFGFKTGLRRTVLFNSLRR